MTQSIFTLKIKNLFLFYTEGITNLGETLIHIYLNLEMRFQIVFITGESMEGADFNYVTLI